jgi:GH25 family lysozyme M1 (1,4-beta-N-acetylmuramidase)
MRNDKHIITIKCDACDKLVDANKNTQITVASEIHIGRGKYHKIHVWNPAMDKAKDLCPKCADKVLAMFGCHLVKR